jgi:hypothetical protein
MTNSCAAFGSESRLIVEGGSNPRTFDSSSERYPIVMETLTVNKPLQGRRLIVGGLDIYDVALRGHSYLAAGAIVLQMTPANLANWLPRIMGATPTGNVYPLGSVFPGFDILIDRENGVFRYTDCVITKAVIRAKNESGQNPQQEEFVELILYVFATDETYATTWPSPEPTLSLTGVNAPYVEWEGVLMVDTNDTSFREFTLTIDNNMQPLFYNSRSPACFRSAGRQITLETENPFTTTTLADSISMLDTALPGTLTFTSDVNPTLSTVFTFGGLRNSYRAPNVRGKGEIPLTLNLMAVTTASDPALEVTNDATI